MILFAVYSLIGSVLILDRVWDIAADAPHPDAVALTVVRWILTWPLWAFRS